MSCSQVYKRTALKYTSIMFTATQNELNTAMMAMMMRSAAAEVLA